MASPAPAKSPLHNFSLPQLKWTKNHTNNHQRGRRTAESSPTADSPTRRQSPLLDSAPRQSPMRDSASESESGYTSENRKNSTPESDKDGFLVTTPDLKIEKSEKKSPAASSVEGSAVKDVRSRIFIRVRTKSKPDDTQDEGKKTTEEGESEELMAKTWNLRPRKPIGKQPYSNGGTSKVGGASLPENKTQFQQATPGRPESTLRRSSSEAEASEKKEKRQKFSLCLSRHEIEEDIFAMTGTKAARRPKKRAKNVQKVLDNLFPGLWLASVNLDSYKVAEAPLKG